MALKSSQDKITSSNKNNESESEDNKLDSSKDAQETKRKSKSSKKNTKQRVNPNLVAGPSNVVTMRTRRRVPTSLPIVPVIPVTTVATYYPQYASSSLNYPVVNEWNPVSALQVPNPFNVSYPPVPIVITPQVLAPICPYSGAFMSQPIITPVIPPVIVEEVSNYGFEATFSPEQIVPTDAYQIQDGNVSTLSIEETLYETVEYRRYMDPVEYYLTLPRQMFPKARMLALDPNPLIDEFCKIVNIHSHAPWILDLEFGVPRVPITRPIAMYDVKFNSVHCKNAPNAIHPGFESCNQEFKRVLLFYYDCVISSWYRGYTQMCCDGSVENFESWMLLPM